MILKNLRDQAIELEQTWYALSEGQDIFEATGRGGGGGGEWNGMELIADVQAVSAWPQDTRGLWEWGLGPSFLWRLRGHAKLKRDATANKPKPFLDRDP